jgi:hypothetical protein
VTDDPTALLLASWTPDEHPSFLVILRPAAIALPG